MKLLHFKRCEGWQFCHKVLNPNCKIHNCDNLRCNCINMYEKKIKTIEIKRVIL